MGCNSSTENKKVENPLAAPAGAAPKSAEPKLKSKEEEEAAKRIQHLFRNKSSKQRLDFNTHWKVTFLLRYF